MQYDPRGCAVASEYVRGTHAALPHRLATTWPVARDERGALGAMASVADVQRAAHAKCVRLLRAQESMARTLGMVATAWHARERDAPLAAQAKRLCQEAQDALATGDAGDAEPDASLVEEARALLDAVAEHEASVSHMMRACGPPRTLTRVWPLVLAYPLVSWALVRGLYVHGASLRAQAASVCDAVHGLVVHWVFEPLLRLLDTLRAGRAERAQLVRVESLAANEQSLERMVASLGRDKLRLDDEALAALQARTRAGDLTSVMQLYEAAIRTPLRALLTGTLVRPVLIQVQKAKVDLETALSGIEWVLRSQELLIGAMGVAPALVLVYALVVGVRRGVAALLDRSTQRVRRTQRSQVDAWEALRRMDALCAGAAPGPAPYGRLLLDVCALGTSLEALLRTACRGERAMAQRLWLEVRADLAELECASASWAQRHAVVARMWRSWGRLLAWEARAPWHL